VLLAALSALCAAVALLCAVLVLVHAFRRSAGTGAMVLLVPAYVLLYAFSQFEHRHKGLVVAGLIGCGTLAAVLFGAGVARLADAPPPPFEQRLP
jgi:MFS family permease